MKNWIPAFKLIGVGFYIAACITGGILGGWWLGDKKPVFVIIGFILGLVLAFGGVYSMVRPLMGNPNNNGKKRDNGK